LKYSMQLQLGCIYFPFSGSRNCFKLLICKSAYYFLSLFLSSCLPILSWRDSWWFLCCYQLLWIPAEGVDSREQNRGCEALQVHYPCCPWKFSFVCSQISINTYLIDLYQVRQLLRNRLWYVQRNVGTVYGGHERLDLKIKSFRLHLHRRAHRGLHVQQGTKQWVHSASRLRLSGKTQIDNPTESSQSDYGFVAHKMFIDVWWMMGMLSLDPSSCAPRFYH